MESSFPLAKTNQAHHPPGLPCQGCALLSNPQRGGQTKPVRWLSHQGASDGAGGPDLATQGPLPCPALSTNMHLPTIAITEMESTERAEKFHMQNCAFKYGISPRALLYYYSNFLRRASIQCSVSLPPLETWKSDRDIQVCLSG